MVLSTIIIAVMYANIIKYEIVSFHAKKARITRNIDFLIFEFEAAHMVAINNQIAIASSLLFSALKKSIAGCVIFIFYSWVRCASPAGRGLATDFDRMIIFDLHRHLKKRRHSQVCCSSVMVQFCALIFPTISV